MDKKQLRLQALKMVAKGVPRSRKRKNTVKKCGLLKNDELAKKLKKGYGMYLSTVDVEMAKWSFKQDTGLILILTETKHDRIYKLSLG